MREKSRQELNKIMQDIVDTYKDKPLLHKKMTEIYLRFRNCSSIRGYKYKELAKLTAKVNFKCYFKNGKCKRTYNNEMCCCKDCRDTVGHCTTIFFNNYSEKGFIEEELLYYAKKFSIKTGYWRKNKGCILPRERRSPTCLTYNHSSGLTNHEQLLFKLINDCRNSEEHHLSLLIQILKDYFLYRDN